MFQRAIVVGASSGIGAALVRQMVHHGFQVVAVARRQPELERLCQEVNAAVGETRAWPLVHDVTQVESARAAFDEAVRRLDGLDVIVYAAGVMPVVDERTFDARIDADIVATNLTGAMAWLNPAAERFLTLRGGTLVGIGSVAGDRGRSGNPAYCASKAALHTWLESMRNRLSRHGVRVLTIKPGPVDTPMTQGRGKLPLLIDADTAAAGILAALRGGADTRYVPLPWWPIMTTIQAIPSPIFRRMKLP
jgi:NAD(P)-dependent dehydrogenase (short-subunit alcohol dehydrogenase family)